MTSPNDNAFALYKAGNPDRVRLIERAIAKLTSDGHEVSVETLQAILPDDFSLDPQLDFLSYIAAAESGIVTAKMAPKETGDGATADDGKPEVEVEAEVETVDALRERVIAFDQKAAAFRAELYVLRNQLAEARSVLAGHFEAFAHGVGAKVTQQENVRAEIAASLADRAARKENPNVAPIACNSSILDRTAMFSGHAGSSNGDGVDYLRKQMRTGFRRGAFSASQKSTRLRVVPIEQ